MNLSDAVPDEMPEFSLSGRAGPVLDEQLLDALLTGQRLSPDAPEQATVVSEMLASLADPVFSGHLAGEEAARKAFVRAASPAHRRRSSRRPGRLSIRLAAALTAVAAGLSGTAAAYAGALPAPVQDLAHYALGAPPSRDHHGHRKPGIAPSTHPASPASIVPGRGNAYGVGNGKAKGHTKGKAKGKAKGHGIATGLAGQPPGKAKGHSKAQK